MLPAMLLPVAMADPADSWAPVLLLIVIGLLFAIGSLVVSLLIGPSRTGAAKEATYESGMMPIGDARRRKRPAGDEQRAELHPRLFRETEVGVAEQLADLHCHALQVTERLYQLAGDSRVCASPQCTTFTAVEQQRS